jgi:Arm DNA-binding domain
MKLTLNRIGGLKCPPGKRDMLVFDDEQRGLGVRVTASGGKTYLAQYTWHGQKRRVPLGGCGALSLAKARDAVRVILGDVARGIDPATERKMAIAEARAAAGALPLGHLLSGLAGHTPGSQAPALCNRGHPRAAQCLPPVF